MSKKYSLAIPGKERPNLLSLFNTYIIRKVKEEREKWKNRYSSRSGILYDYYDDDEYVEEMEQLRRFYGGCFPNSGGCILDPLNDDEWDDDDYDDYEVGANGEIIFPINKDTNLEKTLRPGEYHRSAQDMDDYWNKMAKFNQNGKKKHMKHRGNRGGKKAKVIDISEPYNANYIDNDGDALDSCIIYFYEDYHNKYDRIEFNNLYEFDKYCQETGFTVPSYIAEQIAYAPVSHCCLNPIAKEHGELEVMREETYGDMFYEACESNELGG